MGVLGTGAVVRYALLEPARRCGGVSVSAVGSRTLERGRAFASEHGIPSSDSYERVVTDPGIDAVYIALPNSLHAEWCVRSLEAGKAVLCEKPLTSNAWEAARCAAVADRMRRPLVEGFHWRYHPLARRLQEVAVLVGPLRKVSVRFGYARKFLQTNDIRLDFQLSGGVLMDAGCYCLNLLRALVAEPVCVLEAAAVSAARDVDTRIEATLAFPEGITGEISAANDLDGERFDILCRLEGEAGTASATNVFLPHLGSRVDIERGRERWSETMDTTPSYDFQLRNFVRLVRGDIAANLTPGSDAVLNMGWIDEIYRRAGLEPRGPRPFP